MTWIDYALLFFVGQPVALFFGYTLGIQYQRDDWPGWVPYVGNQPFPQWLRDCCELVAAITLVIDVSTNMFVVTVYLWQLPKDTEYTFSERLERLVTETGWRSRIAWPIAKVLNWIAPPGHPHILNAMEKK